MTLKRSLPVAAALLLTAAHAAPAVAQQPPADAAALVKVLETPDAPAFEKAKACQRLAVVGTKEAVPALAALLGDEALGTYARTALEGIPDEAAAAALREAAGRLEGRALVGVLNSIGQRGDRQAPGLLRNLLSHEDPAVASAAAEALGRVAPHEAVSALTKALAESSEKPPVADACLIAAERLAEDGRKDESVALYRAVAEAEVPDYLRADAVQGEIRLRKGEAKDLLLVQIRSENETFFNAGLAAARDVPGADIAEALAKELDNLPPERRALLLAALGDRGEAVPLPLLAETWKSGSPEMRRAAIGILAKSDDPAAAEMLLDAAVGDDEAARLARQGLERHAGRGVDAAIVKRLADARGPATIALLGLVGARRVGDARKAVVAALDDEDPAVRTAALAAFAQIIDLDDLSLLVERAKAAKSPEETAAARAALTAAALRTDDRDATAERLAATLEGASADYQTHVLELLGKLGGEKALAVVLSVVKSGGPALKDAATRVLGEWPDPSAAPGLLGIAKNDEEAKYRIRALRGYLRIARQLQLPTEERLAMFRTAMETAQRDEERALAMDVLSRVPSAETLELAVSHLGEPALRDAAAGAAVRIGAALLSSDPKAVAGAMQKVVDSGVGGDLAAKSRQLLEQARSAKSQ